MESKILINNVLACTLCSKVLTCIGNYSIFDIGELSDDMDPLSCLELTKCWEHRNTHDTPTTFRFNELPSHIHTLIEVLPTVLNCPLMIHAATDDVKPGTYEGILEQSSDVEYRTVGIGYLSSLLRFETEFIGIHDGKIVEPPTDFLRKGRVYNIPERTFRTPFIVDNIILCPRCHKTLVLTGYGTFIPLGESVYSNLRLEIPRTKDMSLIFFGGCYTCKIEDGITDVELGGYIGLLFLRDTYVIPKISRSFPTGATIKKIPGAEEISILNTREVCETLINTCTPWVLEDNMGIPGYGDFAVF
jgi:hypothetical protein